MKYLPALLLFILSFNLQAQYDVGNWYLSTDASLTRTTQPNDGDLFRSSISGGFFLENNLMIGARLQIDSDLEPGFRSPAYRVEPFVRYYLPTNRMRRLRYFAEAGVGLLFEDNLQTYLRGGVGAEYQLAPGIMATAGLRYNTEARTKPRGLTFDLGVNLVFGDLEGDDDQPIGNRKGTFVLDATMGELTFGKVGGINLVSGELALTGGYFLTNKLLLEGGVRFSATGVRYYAPEESLSRNSRISASLGARYLFNDGRKFQPYLAAGMRYDRESSSTEREGSEPSGSSLEGFSADFKGGFLYNFNRRVALDVNLGISQGVSGEDLPRMVGGVGLKVFLGKN